MLSFGSISENPISAFSDAASSGVSTRQPTDSLDVRDSIVKQLVLRVLDSAHFSDGVDVSRPPLQLVVTDRQDFADSIRFQHHRIFPDNFSLTDQTALSRPSRNLALADDLSLSDAVTLEQLAQLRTIAPTDDEQVSDAIFLQHLMRDLRAMDAVQFADAVLVSLLTRDIRLTDNVHLSDADILTHFGPDGEEIEAILAGIRTFTCTPGYDLQREAITKTGVADFDQPGLFSVVNGAARPAYKFVINIPALTKIQADSMSAFHFFHQGGKAFYIDGFQAWSFVSTLNLIGEGNGVRKEFFLPNRHITSTSLTVAVFDGATHSITTAFSLVSAAAGLISFATAPDSGDDIEASHAHKYKVVFDPDGFKLDEFASGVFRAQLKLRELG